MKKSLLIAIASLAVLVAITATAERKIWFYSHDGNHQSMDVTMLDSISFEEPGTLTLSPESKSLDSDGGRFTVTITANKAWTATVNDPTALVISPTSGAGNGSINVLASQNTEDKSYSAILTVTLANGLYKQMVVTVAGKSDSTPSGEKCKASDYAQVTIGTQTWMAENYKCSKYDTKSEAYNASWLTNNTVPTSDSYTYTPYYTDATDKTKWYTQDGDYSENLSNEQIAKLGYLYNWAAAVGVENGVNRTWAFAGDRQGICPNGWHVPTQAEWQTLYDYIYNAQGLSSNEAGQYLKTTSGWYENGNGTDSYGFAALPSGDAFGSYVDKVGKYAFFMSVTPYLRYSGDGRAYYRLLKHDNDALGEEGEANLVGLSVRCVKNSVDDAETLSVSPLSKDFGSSGGTFDITVTSITAWEVSSNQTWATLSVSTGSGNAAITVTIAENSSSTADVATIELITPSGIKASVAINRAGVILPVTDICGNTYPVVTVGTQTWMAENYKCSKYDTQSEAYNASWLTNNTVPTSNIYTDSPYYTDATDKTKWSSTVYSGNLSNEQIAKLGYFYNWAAAVGVENGHDYGRTPFSGNRQGICPNGWHIPTKAEWQALYDYIYNNQQLSDNTVGKYMKTTSGWYKNGNGTDSYGFGVLPSGHASGSSVSDVGNDVYYWTATPDENDSDDAYYWYLSYFKDNLNDFDSYKRAGQSVRCLRN